MSAHKLYFTLQGFDFSDSHSSSLKITFFNRNTHYVVRTTLWSFLKKALFQEKTNWQHNSGRNQLLRWPAEIYSRIVASCNKTVRGCVFSFWRGMRLVSWFVFCCMHFCSCTTLRSFIELVIKQISNRYFHSKSCKVFKYSNVQIGHFVQPCLWNQRTQCFIFERYLKVLATLSCFCFCCQQISSLV